MELDNTESMSHTAMGSFYFFTGQQAQAIASFRVPFELDPGSTLRADSSVCSLHSQVNRRRLSRTLRRHPVEPEESAIYSSLAATGWAHFAAGRYEEAIEWLEQSRQSSRLQSRSSWTRCELRDRRATGGGSGRV